MRTEVPLVINGTIRHRTPTKNLLISKKIYTLSLDKFRCNYKRISQLCREGCINYGIKHSCPPRSPNFPDYFKGISSANLIMYSINLEQYAPLNYYQRIKASNSVLKSILDRELYEFKKKGFIVAGSGSCRACKPCGAKQKVSCKKPKRKIYSLESMGVNVNALVEQCFGFPLEWYRRGESLPRTTCVIGAVECSNVKLQT